ncbi:MAG: hypothetical protein IJA15_04730 [Clostridia bacterium]|nr:hypothetical protein [Clostridia bacterium]
MKKFISLLCCLLMALTPLFVTACGGTGEDGGSSIEIPKEDEAKTSVYVELKSGGTGINWLIDAGTRFSALKANESYEAGKMGVTIIPKPVENPSIKNAQTSGSAIIDVMGQVNIEDAARNEQVIAIDDVLTTKNDIREGQPISPLDKISADQRSRYMYNGHYYAGPSCEYYPVINYDRNLFDKYHTYLARPEAYTNADLTVLASEVLNAPFYFLSDFTGNDADLKSCGPDGEYGTDDDGLPSSLYELIALCEHLKSLGINPFNFTGGYKYYSNFLLSALYTSLQGYEGARNNYEFNGESIIVDGFEDANLFGLDGVKVPKTKVVEVTEATGYLTTKEVEKYYAEAFMALCIERDWFGPSVYNGESQKAAISKFVFSDSGNRPKIAMHLDGSYWYNEATEGDNYFEQWAQANSLTGFESRDVRVMPLPVNIAESVQVGEGKPQTLLEMNYGMFVINGNLKNNPGLLRAAKEFLAFLYTDAELSAYTANTSILRSMDYSLSSNDVSRISKYGKLLIDSVSKGESKVVYFAAENATFKANTASFEQSWTNAVFSVSGIPSLYQALYEYNKTLTECFNAQQISESIWKGMYKGN